ncbi:MAG: CCA tRNA nucleotidyltransferase [Nitratireductor sp.]
MTLVPDLPDKMPERLSWEQAPFLADPCLVKLFETLATGGGETRINGGAVRNALLGEPVTEVDLSTTLEPDVVTRCLEAAGIKVVATGKEHGTVTAICDGSGYEITTLRRDVETDGRRAVVAFGTDWKEDARRRDLTMNALYCDADGRLHDPLDGYGDLRARRVRFIGEAENRISEDYLRILRFFRFFAWYGQGRPDAEGLKACSRLKANIAQLSVERIWMELKKLLNAPDPTRAILWMRTTGVLGEVLPESIKWGTDSFPALIGLETEIPQQVDPLLRLMAIIPPRAEITSGLSKRLKLSTREGERLANWVEAGEPVPHVADGDFARQLYLSEPQAVCDRLVIAMARISTYEKDGNKRSAQIRRFAQLLEFARNWKRPQFPVNGSDLIATGIHPGPELGRVLGMLEHAWLESGFTLSRDELIAKAGNQAK